MKKALRALLLACGLIGAFAGAALAANCTLTTQASTTITFTCFTNSDGNYSLTSNPGQPVTTGAAWNSSTSSATTQTLVAAVGAQAIQVQLDQTTTITGGAVTFQGSYDGTNWITVPSSQITSPTGGSISGLSAGIYTLVASTNQPFLVQMGGFQSLRLNLSTVITGSGSVTPYITTLFYTPAVVSATNNAGCVGQSVANTSTALINLTASGQLITGTSGQQIYICHIDLVTGSAQNIALVEGTGSVCASGTAGLAGGTTAGTGWNFAANFGIAAGDGRGLVTKTATAADNVCALLSGSGQVSGAITYVKF